MKSSLNLMSERSRNRNTLRACIRVWSRVLTVLLLLLALVGFAKWRACAQEQTKRDSAEAEYEPIRQLKLENGRMKNQIASLRKAEWVALKLAKHQPLLGIIATAAQAVADQEGQLYLQHIEIEHDLLKLDTQGAPALAVGLEGTTIDSGAVTRLAAALREVGPFAKVELSTNATTPSSKQTKQVFSIQCVQ